MWPIRATCGKETRISDSKGRIPDIFTMRVGYIVMVLPSEKGMGIKMRQYELFELTFRGEEPEGSLVEVDLTAEFTCGEDSFKVKGFYAGDNSYRVRFYPGKAGQWTWKVGGVVEAQGVEICLPGDETSGQRGIVHAGGMHFYYEDGTLYQPFGTTIYALVHQPRKLIDTTMRTLAEAPFNKVRFCVFPKYYDYNKDEPEYFAFALEGGKPNVHKPCMPFWDELEARIRQLDAMGIQGDLILFHPYDKWGFAKLTKEEALVYLDYLTRRLSAFPNLWWSLANEFDLMEDFRREWWEDFAAYVAENDPYHHCLSNHNCLEMWDFSNEHTTHCCVQGSGVWEVESLLKKYRKPVIYDECCYEGNIEFDWGNISGFEMVNRFWTAVVSGGYCTHGETFLDKEDILWWAKGGTLRGQSPKRIAFLRKLVESLPGPIENSIQGTMGKLEHIRQCQREGAALEQGIFARKLLLATDVRLMEICEIQTPIEGHCGEDAYIRYCRRQCAGVGTLALPETGSYRVEVIDAWEMTRQVVAEGVSGEVKLELPGKEGIALLATRIT